MDKVNGFPNFYEVKLQCGGTAKVAPLHFGSPENLEIAELQTKAIDTKDNTVFLREAKRFCLALRDSLAENHTPEQVDKIMKCLRFSVRVTSPYMQCMFALMGQEPITEDVLAELMKAQAKAQE